MERLAEESRAIDGEIVFRASPDKENEIPQDEIVTLDGEPLYRIGRYDSMPPFLMSLVSDTDLWAYVSSYGPLAAGRVDEHHCLFPYVTDDQLHKAIGQTGPVTLLRVRRAGGEAHVWEPFARFPAPAGTERNLYKSLHSNLIAFEEINHDLGLTLRAAWAPCDRFGFVRSVAIENNDGAAAAEIEILDGLVNILPAGVNLAITQRYSCLIDAYTRCEVDRETGLAIFAMTSPIIDRAEPAESLVANTVWSRGLPGARYLLSVDQAPAFQRGQPIHGEDLLTGRRGAFLVSAAVALEPGDTASWDMAADVNRDQAQVEAMRSFLREGRDPRGALRKSLCQGRESLARIVSAADGQQATADTAAVWHHSACVLFNNMRGGVFADGYRVSRPDFMEFVAARNKRIAGEYFALLSGLPETLLADDLIAAAAQSGSSDLLRLAREYLPLTFSRRHGDPSRPWNRFAICVKKSDGAQILDYSGNWRDIFQNWEALCASFPGFIEGMIARFVNASTVDGFNPYRIMRDGFEWETPDPDDPWSSIGYWGDHQIVYLLKLLEASHRYHPGLLEGLLGESCYSYANVPYRIKPYQDILRDSRNTIIFDRDLHGRTLARAAELGADAKLVADSEGRVYHVPLAEKLLVPALAKLSNLVLDGGIWMNTQRPEWNDANNALVGNGISIVTLCYLRRYLAFCRDLFERNRAQSTSISAEVADWLHAVRETLRRCVDLLNQPEISDQGRRALLDTLGQAFSSYRDTVYRQGFSGRVDVAIAEFRDLCEIALPFLDHSIRASRRDDGLYHAYNLLDISTPSSARIRRMYEMLEGQVAVLSAGVLSPSEAAALLQSLFESRLYRPDQKSFLLYPARQLPGFLEKNVLPEERVAGNPLFAALLAAGNTEIVLRDTAGHYRFSARLRNSNDLQAALDRLAGEAAWQALVRANRADIMDTYELVFDHHSFTGRSGAMYGYEGLGCIYWHMVSKLLVAAEQCHHHAEAAGAPAQTVQNLANLYYRIRAGLGYGKTAHEYGAFPPDPYSHTPAHSGARQPGMTGQSKEDILARWGELGIEVQDGCIGFRPTLLRLAEFFDQPTTWRYFDHEGRHRSLALCAGSLAFTLCQKPVVYKLSDTAAQITIHRAGASQAIAGNRLDRAASEEIFSRRTNISLIEVSVPRSVLMQ